MKATEQALPLAPRTDLRWLAELLKALADETRLNILTMLREGEMCVCEIMDALPLSQPAISHHLKILRQAGLVTDRRQGKWIYYDLDPRGLERILSLLQAAGLWPANLRQDGSGRRRSSRCKDD